MLIIAFIVFVLGVIVGWFFKGYAIFSDKEEKRMKYWSGRKPESLLEIFDRLKIYKDKDGISRSH